MPGKIRDAIAEEKIVVAIVGCIQFFVAVEGSLLLPLGPTLARDLNFSVAHLGYMNASFLICACISGLCGAVLFDSFSRRLTIGLAIGGLAISTCLNAFATSLEYLVLARALGGLFGGPAMALSIALVADIVPVERRGRALGKVARGSAVALVLGVPVTLALAELIGWRESMLLVGAVGVALAAASIALLPAHHRGASGMSLGRLLREFGEMLAERRAWVTLVMMSLNGAVILMVLANLAPFFIGNLGFPEHNLKYLWAAGGLCGLVGSQVGGTVADRYGVRLTLITVTVIASISYFMMFIAPGLGGLLFFTYCAYNLAVSGRAVAINLILSMVPKPEQRGRFMSLMASGSQASAAIAVTVVGNYLVVGPSHHIENMDRVAWVAIAIAATVAALGCWLVVDSTRRRETSAAAITLVAEGA